MKSLITLLSAAALLASGISAAPLEVRGAIEARGTQEYDIDGSLGRWIKRAHTKLIMNSVCSTDGGWEVWAQVEIEQAFREDFNLDKSKSIREVSDVYVDAKRADFVLPADKTMKGAIIELKCENTGEQRGGAVGPPVSKDKDKKFSVRTAYKDYSFMALAMAYTPEAEQALTKIGMRAIPGARVALDKNKGTMKIFKEVLKNSLTIDTEMMQLTNLFDNLNTKPKPKSPTSPKAGPANPAPNKPAGSGKGKGKSSGST